MAYYNLTVNNEDEFMGMMIVRDEGLVTGMVEGVLEAIDKGLKKVDLVQVNIEDSEVDNAYYVVSIKESEYTSLLNRCFDDMVKFERYEICDKIKSYIESKKDL